LIINFDENLDCDRRPRTCMGSFSYQFLS